MIKYTLPSVKHAKISTGVLASAACERNISVGTKQCQTELCPAQIRVQSVASLAKSLLFLSSSYKVVLLR